MAAKDDSKPTDPKASTTPRPEAAKAAVRDPLHANPDAGQADLPQSPRVSPVADAHNVPADVENADVPTAEAKGVEPVQPKDQDAYEAYRTELHTSDTPVISEGTRQELEANGRATDPNTGRVIVKGDGDAEAKYL